MIKRTKDFIQQRSSSIKEILGVAAATIGVVGLASLGLALGLLLMISPLLVSALVVQFCVNALSALFGYPAITFAQAIAFTIIAAAVVCLIPDRKPTVIVAPTNTPSAKPQALPQKGIPTPAKAKLQNYTRADAGDIFNEVE